MCEFCLKNNWKYGDEFIKKVDYNFKLYLDKYYYDYNFYDNKSNIIKDYSDDEKPDIKLDCSDMIELKNKDTKYNLLHKSKMGE